RVTLRRYPQFEGLSFNAARAQMARATRNGQRLIDHLMLQWDRTPRGRFWQWVESLPLGLFRNGTLMLLMGIGISVALRLTFGNDLAGATTGGEFLSIIPGICAISKGSSKPDERGPYLPAEVFAMMMKARSIARLPSRLDLLLKAQAKLRKMERYESPRLANMIAITSLHMGDAALTVRQARKALGLAYECRASYPAFSQREASFAQCVLSKAYLELCQTRESVAAAAKSVKLAPDDYFAQVQLAAALFAAGKFEPALASAQTALMLSPPSRKVETLAQVARTHIALGSLEEARTTVQQIPADQACRAKFLAEIDGIIQKAAQRKQERIKEKRIVRIREVVDQLVGGDIFEMSKSRAVSVRTRMGMPPVYLTTNHGSSYGIWEAMNIQRRTHGAREIERATAVHFDNHSDLATTPLGERPQTVIDALKFVFDEKYHYRHGAFNYPAIKQGMFWEFWHVVPEIYPGMEYSESDDPLWEKAKEFHGMLYFGELVNVKGDKEQFCTDDSKELTAYKNVVWTSSVFYHKTDINGLPDFAGLQHDLILSIDADYIHDGIDLGYRNIQWPKIEAENDAIVERELERLSAYIAGLKKNPLVTILALSPRYCPDIYHARIVQGVLDALHERFGLETTAEGLYIFDPLTQAVMESTSNFNEFTFPVTVTVSEGIDAAVAGILKQFADTVYNKFGIEISIEEKWSSTEDARDAQAVAQLEMLEGAKVTVYVRGYWTRDVLIQVHKQIRQILEGEHVAEVIIDEQPNGNNRSSGTYANSALLFLGNEAIGLESVNTADVVEANWLLPFLIVLAFGVIVLLVRALARSVDQAPPMTLQEHFARKATERELAREFIEMTVDTLQRLIVAERDVSSDILNIIAVLQLFHELDARSEYERELLCNGLIEERIMFSAMASLYQDVKDRGLRQRVQWIKLAFSNATGDAMRKDEIIGIDEDKVIYFWHRLEELHQDSLDGMTIVRFSHGYDSEGGVQQHLKYLNRTLLQRNAATIIQMYLAKDGDSLETEETSIGKGKLITVPVIRCARTKGIVGARCESFLYDCIRGMIRFSSVKEFIRERLLHGAASVILARLPLVKQFYTRRWTGDNAEAIRCKVVEIFARYQVDLVIGHSLYRCGDCVALAQEAHARDIPVIMQHHGNNHMFDRFDIRRFALSLEGLAGVYGSHVPAQVATLFRNLGNGIDTQLFKPKKTDMDPDHAVILFPASVTYRKGQLDFIRIAKFLRDRGLDIQIVFAGGTGDKAYKKQVDELA
ncbi:hypothetical protein ACFL38_05325, partial [Candidatus Omnitrophota bacterium]